MWKVVCFDTFAGDFYGESRHRREETARQKAEARKNSILRTQPGAGGLQDRVYLINPEGRQLIYHST